MAAELDSFDQHAERMGELIRQASNPVGDKRPLVLFLQTLMLCDVSMDKLYEALVFATSPDVSDRPVNGWIEQAAIFMADQLTDASARG